MLYRDKHDEIRKLIVRRIEITRFYIEMVRFYEILKI